jgi:alpha-galactosidase
MEFMEHLHEQISMKNLVKKLLNIILLLAWRQGLLYIVLDDGWMAKGAMLKGNLVPRSIKFPSGMKSLVRIIFMPKDYNLVYIIVQAHLQISWNSVGMNIKMPFYADLNIDFLKYDWCNTEGINAKEAYTTMVTHWLTGKANRFSLCEWGDNQP